MPADLPEITTNEEWCTLMIAARRERKWTQLELAVKVAAHSKLSATQALISQIETSAIRSSSLIRPICEVLSIPEPMHFQDEEMKKWWLAGHLMRAKSGSLFKLQLALAESTLRELAANDTAEPIETSSETKPPRK